MKHITSTCALCVIVILTASAAAQDDLTTELLRRDAEPCESCVQLGLDAYENAVNAIFDAAQGREKVWRRVVLRREPSFGYPQEIVVSMGKNPRAMAYEISNQLTLPKRNVSLFEHLELLADKYKTEDADEISKYIRVQATEVNPRVFDQLIADLKRLPVAPEFNKSDAIEIAGDGVGYLVFVDTPTSQLRFNARVGSTATGPQRKLQERVQQIWSQVFPNTRFDNAGQ